MSSYKVSSVVQWGSLNPKSMYLTLINIDSPPPHIALINKQIYFSLSTKGVKTNIDAEQRLVSLKRKGQCTLLLELTCDIPNRLIFDIFEQYPSLSESESCLNPIKEVLELNRIDCSNAKYAFDIIELLLQKQFIRNQYHINCDTIIFDQSLFIAKYDQNTIDRHIRKLTPKT